MANGINWKGDEVVKIVEKLSAEKMKDFIEDITAGAKDKSPYKTGHNRATITWDEQEEKFRVYTQSGYGAWLELGTAKMPARPYIFAAYEESKAAFFKNLEGSV